MLPISTVFRSILLATASVAWTQAGAQSNKPAQSLTVFAAASLKEAMDEQASAFEKTSSQRVRVSYAGSNALAKQIEQGAPASLFISADESWMDYLAAKKLIVTNTRRNIVGNELVLIAPSGSSIAIDLASGSKARDALTKALSDTRIAMADPSAVPAGKYAQAALTQLGLWNVVQPRIARTDNVRAALAFVARSEAPLGVVYRSDALAEPKVKIVATFPATSHPPIVYPASVVAANDSPAARQWLDFLSSDAARTVWQKHGFVNLQR